MEENKEIFENEDVVVFEVEEEFSEEQLKEMYGEILAEIPNAPITHSAEESL